MSKLFIAVLITLGSVLSVVRHFATVAPDARSIAVLPFVDLSSARDQSYFTDGLTEEIMNRLGRAGLQVAASDSSFAFKGHNVETSEIARRLHVDAVLEGSIRREGSHLRATVKLFDAKKRSVIWSDSFDRRASDAFALQDELSASIATPVNALLVK